MICLLGYNQNSTLDLLHVCLKKSSSEIMWTMYCLSVCLCFAYLKLTVHSEASVCGRSLAEIEVSNPVGNMDVTRECCGYADRRLCVGLITRPEKSY